MENSFKLNINLRDFWEKDAFAIVLFFSIE